MKKIIFIACVFFSLVIGCFEEKTESKPSQDSTVSSQMLPLGDISELTDEEVAKVANIQKIFAVAHPKDIPFETSIGPYSIKIPGPILIQDVSRVSDIGKNLLASFLLNENTLKGNIQKSLEANQQSIILGSVTIEEVIKESFSQYAKATEESFRNAYQSLTGKRDMQKIKVTANANYTFNLEGIELLGMVSKVLDQLGISIESTMEKHQTIVPNEDPAKVIQLGVPYVKFSGKVFKESIVEPNKDLSKLVKSALPKEWVEEIPFMKLRSTDEAQATAYTPSDKAYVVYYNAPTILKTIKKQLESPTNGFSFATLSKEEQTNKLQNVFRMIMYHEQVHNMTRKIFTLRPKDPNCKECDLLHTQMMEVLAFALTFQHFKEAEVRSTITGIITMLGIPEYKLSYDKFIYPIILDALDEHKGNPCEKGKDVDVDCIFKNNLITKEIVERNVKKVVAYVSTELKSGKYVHR